jgi:hypothetical protein
MTDTHDTAFFEYQAKECFAFLETENRMRFTGVRKVGDGDPREAGLVARYRADEFKVDIGWSEIQQSLTVLIHLSADELPRHLRYVYLDSFVEFITGGDEQSIVPQIYPRMSEAAIFDAMKKRQELFDNRPLVEVLNAMAEKLRRHLDGAVKAPIDVIRGYHEWVASRR